MRIARRYARAVFELAGEAEDLSGWSRRLARLRRLVETPEVRAVLANPTIPRRRRVDVAGALALPVVGAEAANLLKLLILERRLPLLGAVADEYERMVDAALGRVRAAIVTAVELRDDEREKLRRVLSAQVQGDLLPQFQVDPAILGGFVARVGDRMIDASVRTRIQQLRQ